MEADALARVHFQRDSSDKKRAEDADENSTPWLCWDIPGRNRLGLSGPVGRGQPETGRQRAFALDDALGSGARVRTGSR